MVSFSLRRRISLPPPTGPLSGVLSFESIRGSIPIQVCPSKAVPYMLTFFHIRVRQDPLKKNNRSLL